jgi:hypothetical protein
LLAFAFLSLKIKPSVHPVIFYFLLTGLTVAWWFVFKKIKHKIGFLLFIVLLFTSLWGIIQSSSVQTWLVNKIGASLSQKLNTKLSIQKVDIKFLNQLVLKGVLVEDRKKDTLLFADELKANVTDWFIFKNKVEVKNVQLCDAVINLNRSDSIWNYQFLVDFFSTGKSKKTDKKDLAIDVDEIHLCNIRIYKTDKWVGQDMLLSVKKMDLIFDTFDLSQKKISFNSLVIDEPYFTQKSYTGNRPAYLKKPAGHAVSSNPNTLQWNAAGWQVAGKGIKLINGVYANEKLNNKLPNTYFDGSHMVFSAINATLENFSFLKDTLSAQINLQTNERGGLQVKKLKAYFKFTPDIMEFSNLDLQTNKSRLGNYYAMHFNSFGKDMGNFIEKVTLELHLKSSEVNSDDIAVFAPALKNWKKIFQISGDAKGTIQDFKAKNLLVSTGNSSFNGNLSMAGLPDLNSTFIDLKATELQTNHNDLSLIIPGIKNSKVAFHKLGKIKYTGTFTGFPKDFVAYGTFQTSLGDFTSDLNMKLQNGKDPVFSGRLFSGGFNIGALLNNLKLGMVALNANVYGSGFSADKLKVNVDGKVSRIDFSNYAYRNITMKGNFNKKAFSGFFSIDDPNIKISELYGKVDLSNKNTVLNADAIVDNINLKNIGLSKDNLRLSGAFNLNFTGNTIDNFLGSASIHHASLYKDSIKLSFDSLSIVSQVENNSKVLKIGSNLLQATIAGKFKIMELPNAFTFFLAKYYPAYFKAPKKVSEQNFDFSIQTKEIDDYVQLFNKKLKGFSYADIKGNVHLNKYELNLDADIPSFSYAGKEFTNTQFSGRGNRDSLKAVLLVDNIKLNDSMQFPKSRVYITASNNVSEIHLFTSANKTLDLAELNATVTHREDGLEIQFAQSSFVMNGNKWLLEKDGKISLLPGKVTANKVKFVHDNQHIILSTELNPVTNESDLVADLKQIAIEDFLPIVFTKPELKGNLTGKAIIKNPFNKPVLEFKGNADSFYLDKKYVGDVQLNTHANTSTGKIEFHVKSDGTQNAFEINGNYNTKDTTGTAMDIVLAANRLNLNLLEPYLKTVFSEFNGIATGNIRLYGAKDKIYIVGPANISKGSAVVAFTKCKYLFDQQKINFQKNLIEINSLLLKDTLGNSGIVSGKIHHHFFKDFDFENVRMETSKMLLLNTTKKDNNQFYGTVIGNALVTLEGPLTDMVMNISGQPSVFDSSHIYLPTTDTKESNNIDYIDFIKFGSEMDINKKGSQTSNLTVNLNLVANPACKIDVILDEETGDIIKGEGNGRLNIRVGTMEPLTIRGRYELTKGEYTFNFQTIVNRPFTLRRGTISWNGDPYAAIIDIDAEYLAKNVDVSSLSSGTSARVKEDIIILSHLSGILSKPDISFEFELPERSALRNDYIVIQKLADFTNDANTMNKQVASLLLFGAFINEEQNFFSQQNTLGIATSTIGGLLSGWLTNTFSKELERATNGIVSTWVDINPTLDFQSTKNQLQANIRGGFKFTPGKRWVVYLGGNLDYNNPYFANRKGLFTPDISVELLLRDDGSLRLVGFNKTGVDFTSGQRNRTGIQLSYRKDVDKFSDLFKSSKKLKEEEARKVKERTN